MFSDQLELNDNRIHGSDLSNLSIYKDSLNKLKLSNNQIESLDNLEVFKSFPNLMQLDIDENPIAKIDDYRTKVYEALPNLNVLDGKNKDGESIYSEEDYGEEGELEMAELDDEFEAKIANLPPDQQEKIRNGLMGEDELRQLGLLPESGDEIDYGEEGEEDQDGDGDDGDDAAAKR